MRRQPPSVRVRIALIEVPALLVIALFALTTAAHAGPKSGLHPWVETPRASQPSTVATAPINDTCAGAIQIPCGTFNLAGDTSTANNDYTFPSDSSSCTGFKEDGRDVVYKIVAMAGDSVWVDLSSGTTDAAIYIVTNCSNVAGTCVAGEDSTDVGGTETLRYKFTTAGTYYMIIDSFGDNVGGPWSAIGQLICVVQPPPPVNDRCITATLIPCGLFSFSGTTEFATNDYQFASAGASCFGSAAQGKDVVYRLDVGAGDSVWVNYNSSTDGCVYLVSDCNDVTGTCIAGADKVGANLTEQLRYRFNFGGTYYLILDSKSPNSFGTWTMNGEYVCPQPPQNDLCDYAVGIPCGNFSFAGSTQLAHNYYNFDTDQASCTGYRESGHDLTYTLYATAGDSLWADYYSTADGAIYMVTYCGDTQGTCVVGADNTGVKETEHLRYKFPVSGRYFLILDSFGLDTWGDYTLHGSLVCRRTGVGDAAASGQLELGPPTPNPFRAATAIPFALPQRGRVHLRLLDLQGRVVRTLIEGELPAGTHRLQWDGRDDHGELVRSGVYFVKLSTSEGDAMRRAIFVR